MQSILSLNAGFFEKNEKSVIELIGAVIKGNGQGNVPNDIRDFWSATDGMIYREFQIFGINSHLRESKFYSFPNIIDYNKGFPNIEKKNNFIFGCNKNWFFIFFSDTYKYCVVDKISMKIVREHDSLLELIKYELEK